MAPNDERFTAFAAVTSSSCTVGEAAEALCSVLTPELAGEMLIWMRLGQFLRPGFADVRDLLDKKKE